MRNLMSKLGQTQSIKLSFFSVKEEHRWAELTTPQFENAELK